MNEERPTKVRSRRLAVWLVLLLAVANLPIFVLALASGLTVGDEKVAEAKQAVERVAAVAAARQSAAIARLAGMVDAVSLGLGSDVPSADLCGRFADVLLPLNPAVAAIRVEDAAGPICAQATGGRRQAGAATDGAGVGVAAGEGFVARLPLRDNRTVLVELAAGSESGHLDNIVLDPGETVVVFDDAGHIVAAAGENAPLVEATALAATLSAARTRRMEIRLQDGRWMFAAAEAVDGAELTAVALAPLDTLHAGARRELALAVGLPLLFLIIAIAVAWYGIDRLVVRWVGRLGRVASLYGAGRQSVRVGQLDAAPREIRTLGRTFDDMADRVERRSNELKAALAEKTELLRELHHRVKNNFQLVASLLSLESRDATPDFVRALRVQQDRVHALAIAHRLAYAGGDVSGVPAAALVAEIAERLRQGVGLGEKRLILASPPDAPLLDLDTAVPLALLVTELARPVVAAAELSGSPVEIVMACEDEHLEIAVRGPVAPGPDALSSRLVAAFGRQLAAELVLDSTAGRSVVRIPLVAQKEAGSERSFQNRSRAQSENA